MNELGKLCGGPLDGQFVDLNPFDEDSPVIPKTIKLPDARGDNVYVRWFDNMTRDGQYVYRWADPSTPAVAGPVA